VGGGGGWGGLHNFLCYMAMDVILKVLEGAKAGTKIAVKKDEFLIGRSQKCHLCAGSSSVSRRHCVFTRKEASVTIKDLGSRNGTLVNDKKITGEVELSSGDEIAVGSLKFLVTITHGINNLKRPKVKTVADAVDRAATAGDSSVADDDITKWLLDAPGPPPQAMSETAANETQTIRMDDTNAVQLKKSLDESKAKESGDTSPAEALAEVTTAEEVTGKEASKKKKPGKLPPIPKEASSKDSREAAMQALRNWNRRT